MLWKWRSRQRFNQHCDGLSQTVAIRPGAVAHYLRNSGRFSLRKSLYNLCRTLVVVAIKYDDITVKLWHAGVTKEGSLHKKA